MKVLVCGSRHYNDDDGEFSDVLNRINGSWDLEGNKITEIINGDAKGADRLSTQWAISYGIPVRKFPANWDLHGKRAGPLRNIQMLKEGNPDLVVAFLAPNSRGTKHMIEIAQKAGIPVQIVEIAND